MMEHSSDDTSNVLEAFASIARSGLILLIGDLPHSYKDTILKSMDPMTRLVVNLHPDSCEDDTDAQTLSDLRVAVHCQIPEEFLADVSQHLLNLVVTDAQFSQRLAEQITSMLVEGGCWVILNATERHAASTEDFHRVTIGTCLLLVKKTKLQSNVRRGGRRGKLAGQVRNN